MKHLPIQRAFAAATLVAASLAAQAVEVGPFSSLYIFGDSLSDSGNNLVASNGATGGPSVPAGDWVPTLPYSSGVYSNGPVWVNSFAAGLGLTPYAAPSFLGGGNYAAGGAKVSADGLPQNNFYPPSLKTQLNGYLSNHTVSPTALYVVAGGGNDVRQAGDDVAANPGNADAIVTAAATAYAIDVATMVGTLSAMGAQHIVVWNVPDLGRTPAALAGGAPVAGAASAITGAFNGALSFALAASDVTMFDMFGLVTQIATTGSILGHNFANTTLACGFAGNGCDAATALFWDGIHPTAYTHQVLGEAMSLAAVPEPSIAWLLAAGLATLALRRYRACVGA